MRRFYALIFLVALLCLPSRAALNTQIVWDVRPTNGSDTNGGGWWAASTGTDMTPFNNKNAASCTNCQSATVNISTTDAVTAGTTTITSATANFSAAIVGNVIYVTGGTGAITAARYQVITFTNSTTIVVDRSTGLTTGTGATMNIGGALQTIPTATAINTASNLITVKNEATIVTTANITFGTGQTPGNSAAYGRLLCYTSSRTDGGSCTIQASTNTGLTVLNITSNGWHISGFTIDCNSLGTCIGVVLGNYAVFQKGKVMNFTTYGINTSTAVNTTIVQTEVTGGTSCTAGINNTGGTMNVTQSYIHANACPGIILATNQGDVVSDNVIASNTGATTDGIQSGTFALVAERNTIDNNGRHGIFVTTASGVIGSFVKNNMLTNNGQSSGTGYGFVLGTSASAAAYRYDGNCYYNNKTGTRNFADDTTVNKIDGIAPYTNVLDVILSSDPYTNEAGGDLSLNNTASAGAACRSVGSPASLQGYTGTGYPDFGALQTAPAAGLTTHSSAH